MELKLDELLQAQYNKIPYIALFDGTASVNVNLLIHLINTKFYS